MYAPTLHPSDRRWRLRSLATGAAITIAVGLAAAPLSAQADRGHGPRVSQTNLVANRTGYGAAIVDPNLVNAWGMSKFPTSPVWVSDNGTDLTTLYRGGTPAAPGGVSIVPLVVSVPGGPTGQLANPTTAFLLANNASARFIFVNEAGEVYGWNSGTVAQRMAGVDGAVYKGVTLVTVGGALYLLAADLSRGTIDVFDGAWKPVSWPTAFTVKHLPKGFSPFNVQALLDGNGQTHVFVAYAKHEPGSPDEIAGRNLGLVVEFTPDGQMVRRFERDGLNAPWGLAYAPPGWGSASGELLVGQFGNGRIEAFDTKSGEHAGSLGDSSGHPLVIDGLWGLMAGDATAGGVGTVLFTAGPNGEQDGLDGVLAALPGRHDG